MAPGASIVPIKALNADGTADLSTVVAAIEYIYQEHKLYKKDAKIINLSLGADVGSTEYTALDVAVDAAVAAGITVIVSAGNEGIDASHVTPAHAAGAITVGAYDVYNRFAGFSNYGPEVDLLAPGVDILSMLDEGVMALSSGTSMAAAHVTGAAALYLAQNIQASPDDVRVWLLSQAQPMVHGTPPSTTNLSVWVAQDEELDDLPDEAPDDDDD